MARKRGGEEASKPHALIAIGDLHAASTVGIMPPTFTTDSGNVIHANAVQVWLWECWLDFWRTASAYAIDAVIVNGDVPNGINQVDAETVTVNESDQIRVGLAALRPLLDLRDKQGFPIYATRGTGFHSGRAGAREETIWREAGAEPTAQGRYSRWDLLLRWHDRHVYATHHTSTASVYPLTPLWRRLKETAEMAALGVFPLIHVEIRSHIHRCYDAEHAGRRIATTPAWQAPTEFVHKVSPGAATQTGGLIFWRDERNAVQLRKCLYSPPPPTPTELPASRNLSGRSKPSQRTATATRQRK